MHLTSHGRVYSGALHSVLDFFEFEYFKVTRSCFPRVSSHKQLLVSRVSPLFLRPFRVMSNNTRFTRNIRFSEMTRLLIWETRSGFYSTRHSENFPDSILDSSRLWSRRYTHRAISPMAAMKLCILFLIVNT